VVKAGQVARFSRGYTREVRNGKTELHISEKGTVEVDPEGLEKKDYPCIDNFAVAIKDITVSQQTVHVVGRVKTVFPSSTFTRQDSSVGKVFRFIVSDRTGDVMVVAWNDRAEKLEATLRSEVEVKLVNARVKAGSGGGLEVHVDESAYVEFSGV
jgi:ssDNA-binding replication factor A large subunit